MEQNFNMNLFKHLIKQLNQNCIKSDDLAEKLKGFLNLYGEELKIGKVCFISRRSKDSSVMEKNMIVFEGLTGFEEGSPFLKNFYISNLDEEFSVIIYPIIDKNSFTLPELDVLEFFSEIIFTYYSKISNTEKIEEVKLIDTLTTAPNSIYISKLINKISLEGNQADYFCAFINIKNFKFFNSTFGMKVGNDLLKNFYLITRSKLNFTENEILGRMGGDNFLVIMKKTKLNEFLKVLENIEFVIPFANSCKSFKISSRIGIYNITEGASPNFIIENASVALNVAKQLKDSDVVYFNPNMAAKISYEKQLLANFPGALKNKEFKVFYQPKIDSSTNTLIGAEALVRWIKDGKLILPFHFIPIFESDNTICDLDFHVLEQVCQNLRYWIDNGIEPVKISVNFSKNHLKNSGTIKRVLGILKKYEIDSKFIEIELTESAFYEDYDSLVEFVERLRQNGITVSIDDFGTGYSSLNLIRQLSPQVVKIDKTFVDNILEEDERDKTLLKNIINMIKDLGLDIVAEGISTEEQVEFLKNSGCYLVQGYLYDKPLMVDEFYNRLIDKKYE